MPLPDQKGRAEIFKYYLSSLPVDKNIDYDKLASLSARFSGADIKNISDEVGRQVGEKAIEKHEMLIIRMQDILAVLKSVKPSTSLSQLEEYNTFKLDYERRSHPEVQSEEEDKVMIERRRRPRGGEEGAARGGRDTDTASRPGQEVRHRRHKGHPALRASRNREDAPDERSGERAVGGQGADHLGLRPEQARVREGGCLDKGDIQQGEGALPGHRVHRRDRRPGALQGHVHRGGKPAHRGVPAGVRQDKGRAWDSRRRRDEQAGRARPGDPEARQVRQADLRALRRRRQRGRPSSRRTWRRCLSATTWTWASSPRSRRASQAPT